ncbi:hypothetical protein [Paenibacillus sp. PL2-23]|uniref:hypothetical protein n=1 Tax=Paenibacillus sp. PL2-23 TaxID=2100729 RepID=UPI0030FCDAFB
MSIERQLSEAFKRSNSASQLPPALDERIMADYRRLVMEKRGYSHMRKKWRLPRLAFVALIAAMLCGFAYAGNYLLFSDKEGSYSIRMQTNDALTIEPDVLEAVRASLKEVQSKLSPGQTAIVYLPDVFPDALPVSISSLKLIPDAEQWNAVLNQHGVQEVLPDSLLGGSFHFEAGALNSPFRPSMGADVTGLIDEMEAEYRQRDGSSGLLWRSIDIAAEQPVSQYTTMYTNDQGETLYLTMEVIDNVSITFDGLTPPSTAYEAIDLNEKQAHYTRNVQSLLGESPVFQDLMWIEEKDSQTIVHHVESDSGSMTKERMIEAAADWLSKQ